MTRSILIKIYDTEKKNSISGKELGKNLFFIKKTIYD